MRCPICHNPLSLEAITEDEAGQEFYQLFFKQPKELQKPLASYIGLFRKGRDLAYSKNLRLIQEILDLSTPEILAIALHQVVDAMRKKQLDAGAEWQPLKNHNYLKQVIVSAQANYSPVVVERQNMPQQIQRGAPPSKVMQGLAALEQLK